MLDAHVHFWKRQDAQEPILNMHNNLLQQDYLPLQLQNVLKNNGMNACIAVQATGTEVETHFLLELDKKYDFIKGVIGWVDIFGADLAHRLEHFSSFQGLKGYSYNLRGIESSKLQSETFRVALQSIIEKDYSFDLHVDDSQLMTVAALIKAFPKGNFVLDHCGHPPVGKDLTAWKQGIHTLARQPNVTCKLSGLFTEAKWKNWSAAEFYPILDVVFEAFGTKRLLFGSDWPIILLSGMYVQWKSLILKYTDRLEEEQLDAIMGGNATSVYRL